MPAKILDISNPNILFPDFIILDASVVLELKPSPPPSKKNHILALDFFKRLRPLVLQSRVMPLLPLLALEECFFKIIQNILRNTQGSRQYKDWHEFYKANPQSILHSKQLILSFYAILKAFPIVIIEPEDLAKFPIDTAPRLADRMAETIFNYQILPKDATILDDAERLGINTVVTLDSDWKRADGFTVITIP